MDTEPNLKSGEMETEVSNSVGRIEKQNDSTGYPEPVTVHKSAQVDQRGSGMVVVLVLMGALVTLLLILSLIINQLPLLIRAVQFYPIMLVVGAYPCGRPAVIDEGDRKGTPL